MSVNLSVGTLTDADLWALKQALASAQDPGSGPASGGTTPPVVVPPGVRVIDLPWGSPGSGNVRIDTRNNGGFRDEVLAFRIVTPSATSPSYAKISAIESAANLTVVRTACLSQLPGDFDHPVGFARSVGVGVSFAYGVGTASAFYANLKPNATYYLNIKNRDRFGGNTCPAGASCDIFVELAKPSGL
jgi:hypothetical protein